MIIGLTGAAFCGKDTVGAYLARSYHFSTLAFADPIRDMLMTGLNLNHRVFRTENKETAIDWLGKSPRQLMQTLGTDWGRGMVSQSLWIDRMQQRIAAHAAVYSADIVITDVRFTDEAELITRLGGEVWRIVRPETDTTHHCGHISESGQSAITPRLTLINDGTLEMLYESIDAALEMV